jgi:hypothetical protein
VATNVQTFASASGGGLSSHTFPLFTVPAPAVITRVQVGVKYTEPNLTAISSYTVTGALAHAIQIADHGAGINPWYGFPDDPSIAVYDLLEAGEAERIYWAGSGAVVNVNGIEFVGRLEWRGQRRVSVDTDIYYVVANIVPGSYTFTVFITGSVWYAT